MVDNPYLITLGAIRDAGPCDIRPNDAGGWALLLRTLGEPHRKPDLTRVVSIGDVAMSNGARDALWCTRLISDRRAVVRLIEPTVARAVEAAPTDGALFCLAEVRRWLAGDDAGLDAARRAAARATRLATNAAWAAAEAAKAAADTSPRTARAASAATWAAWVVDAADAAGGAERERQRQDIIRVAGLHALKEAKP